MIVNYYSVEDVPAVQFGPLFPAKNDEVAKRMFKALLKEVDVEYFKDYYLHKVLCFDDANGNVGVFCAAEEDVIICNGSVFLEENKK